MFFQPLIYIFHPSSQGPGPGPGACEEGWEMCFFFKWVVEPLESHGVHPLQPISRPCSIEKYPSSRMANRYTRIFDAGGKDQVNRRSLLQRLLWYAVVPDSVVHEMGFEAQQHRLHRKEVSRWSCRGTDHICPYRAIHGWVK